jgi:hypothetical protein
VLALLTYGVASAEDIAVLGRLMSNVPISDLKDECPDGYICLNRWWRTEILVERTLKGSPLSGQITAAVMQHTAMSGHYKRAVRYFVLEAIQDPSTSRKLQANYYLERASIDPPPICASRRCGAH